MATIKKREKFGMQNTDNSKDRVEKREKKSRLFKPGPFLTFYSNRFFIKLRIIFGYAYVIYI